MDRARALRRPVTLSQARAGPRPGNGVPCGDFPLGPGYAMSFLECVYEVSLEIAVQVPKYRTKWCSALQLFAFIFCRAEIVCDLADEIRTACCPQPA